MDGFYSERAKILCIFLILGLSLACGRSTSLPGEPTSIPTTPVLYTATEESTAIPTPTPTQIVITPTSIAAQAINPGDSLRKLFSGGIERSYLLHIPPTVEIARPLSLVLVYHGISLNADEMVRITGFNELADQKGFVVAYPNGTGSRQSWNGGICCGEAVKNAVDDVGFTRALIDDLAEMINLDRKRVYATGFSNGAIMVYRLACDLADEIAAIGPVGAAPAVRSCQPSRPISVIHFHGDSDDMNPYEGGTTASGVKFIPVEMGISAWVQMNQCPIQAQETASGNIVHRVYAPCQQDTAVELYKVLGGEHAWPGGEAVSAQVGEPTDEIDASVLMWEFFSSHPIP